MSIKKIRINQKNIVSTKLHSKDIRRVTKLCTQTNQSTSVIVRGLVLLGLESISVMPTPAKLLTLIKTGAYQ